MAHYAKLDNDNLVIDVNVVDNSVEDDKGEAGVVAWLLEGWGGVAWVKTSYNNNIRKNYAGIGYAYDDGRDAFIPPQPYPSWLLVEETCQWTSPVPYPEDDTHDYTWNEEDLKWDQGELITVVE